MPSLLWQLAVGGQIDADSHGDANFGLRSGEWTFALRTDAPEITWNHEGERGRTWVNVRGHAFAAQMFISPWTDGAPDPARAFNAASAGAEAGWVGYGPWGSYFGGRGAADGFFPYARDTSTELPSQRVVVTADAILGIWRPTLRGWIRAGADLASGGDASLQSPHVVGELQWIPDWSVGKARIGPRVELRAGAAEGQDDLLRSRLGGLNPWVVPLAGAAWAEWWVEDYAAARVGANVGAGEPGAKKLGIRVSPFVDLAAFDGDAAVGLGVGARAWRGRLFLDVTGGYAPWIARAPGIGRGSLWFSIGWDWGTAGGPSETDPPGPPGATWPAR
jgi:hypothetical protein